MSTEYGAMLKAHRTRLKVAQTALAQKLGHASASYIHRRESGEVAMTRAEYAAAIAGVEAVVADRAESADVVQALAEDA